MDEIKELEEKIKKYADAYYAGNELISDAEYDALIEELRALDPNNPLIPGMAGDEDEGEVSNAGYKRINHNLTTGTLDKSNSVEEALKWVKKHYSPRYHVSAKCDGQGFELQYENGQLTHLVSRGDGYTGYDKIVLAQYLDLPKQIPVEKISIRGEFELDNASFKELKVFEGKKNPRNTSAGLLNKKFEEYTPEEIEALKRMKFFAYDIKLEGDFAGIKSKAEVFKVLEDLGFTVPENKVCDTFDEIIAFRNQLMGIRNAGKLEYELDGVVVFDDRLDASDQMEKVQKYATAIKFDLMIGVSTLRDIEWSMSGAYLTPVAIIDPIELEGVTVTRANLCNLNIINNHGIKIGDKVNVMRRGQVIPRIMSKFVE